MNKACPLCGNTKWNYDVIVLGLPEKFCGDCWHDIKAEALKIAKLKFVEALKNE